MILWALLYLSSNLSFALPTHSDIPIDISSFFARDIDKFGTRSIWNIIWSCLSTIFACTWIAVHPNIPAPNDSQWAVLRRRLAIMGFFLIAPEMVIAWAARQHSGAKHFAKRHQSRGWTMAHAYFIMGGFTLHDDQGKPLRILEPMELESLSEGGRIEWPSITEAEIEDRSKGDHFSKGIVLIQTGWFIAQCIVRGAYRLEVTELEVATLAFAALTGITYYVWWNKPLDVRCSIPVYLLKGDEKENLDPQNISSVSPIANPVESSPLISCDLNLNPVDSQSSPPSERTGIPQQILFVTSASGPEADIPDPNKSPRDNATTTPEPQFTPYQQFSAFIRQHRQMRGTILGLTYVFLLHPLRLFLRTILDMLQSNSLRDSMPFRVPTFYSSTFTDYDPTTGSYATVMYVAIIFGSIHCIAWSFHFPSFQEKLAWRISAISVAGLPILISVLIMLIGDFGPRFNVVIISRSIVVALFALYVVARIVLLILPCIALRALNPAASVEIQWSSYLPHIGTQ